MRPALVQLVLSGAKRRAPDRLLKILVKSLAGALVHDFPKVPTAHFNLAASTLRNRCTSAPAGDFPPTINVLAGARGFAPESTSRTRKLQCARR
jgi:hypothetical protein